MPVIIVAAILLLGAAALIVCATIGAVTIIEHWRAEKRLKNLCHSLPCERPRRAVSRSVMGTMR